MFGGSLTDGVLLRVEVVGGVHPVELGVLLGDQLIDVLTFAARVMALKQSLMIQTP